MAGAPDSAIPFFRTADYSGSENPEQLALMSGLLLYDSGEAEETFLYRCQDRYVTYNSLCGFRTVLCVADETHRSVYRTLIEDHDRRMRMVRDRTGIPLPHTPRPWFATVDPTRIEPLALPPGYSLALNQVSPTCARLAGGGLRPMGALALKWHDKAHYVWASQKAEGLPVHAATALLSMDEFAATRTWGQLCAVWSERTGRSEPEALYIKSSYDSGGNAAARVTASTFRSAAQELQTLLNRGSSIAQLHADIDIAPSLASLVFSEEHLHEFLRSQQLRHGTVNLLVQEVIESPEDGDIQGLGITCAIRSEDCVNVVAAAGQIYRDRARHHFCGSYLDGQPINARIAREVRQLCLLLAREGYRGPVNFDARRNAAGDWVFLYDCNPRLSAVYPALAARQFLRSLHWDVRNLANFGYRGEFGRTDLARILTDLDCAELLLKDNRRSGILPLPNLSRAHGLDLVAVNIPYRELAAFAARCHLASGIEFQVF